jgi:AAA-like domain
MRYFNSSGPNIPSEHYTLMREQLVAQGLGLVRRNGYFTIWAPRQTGKSTYFLLLKTQLEQAGYKVVWTNLANFKGAALSGLLRDLRFKIEKEGLTAPLFKTLDDFSNFIERQQGFKLVLIIDEIEGLNPELFGQFIHTIRSLYHSRTDHCLKSVVLVGVSNIVGVVEDNASPFNIADNLNIPFFTPAETRALLGLHEVETGQLFEPAVKEKIVEITACQPGLVNGFAAELVKRCVNKPVIVLDDFLAVEDWYLSEVIDKNIANIVGKARLYRPFVETLLFDEVEIPFNINREEIKVLSINGVIEKDKNGNVVFKVPLYRKCLHAAFYPYTNGERSRLAREIGVEDFFLPDGRLNIEKWIGHYKAWVQRRSFRYFREKDASGQYTSIKEAALIYSFETFVAAFLEEAGGKSYLEPHTGLGRSDLIIHVKGHEYIIEFKVYGGKAAFFKGKKQLAYYCNKAGLKTGEYLVFIPNQIRLPDTVQESIETVEGVAVRSWLVPYDEEKDF